MRFLKQFKDGFLAPLWGAKFLFTHPKIIILASLPTIINFFIYIFLSYIAYRNFGKLMSYFAFQPQAWYQYMLYYLIGLFIAVFIVTIIIFTFTVVGNLIASPFNDLITKEVHIALSGQPLPEYGTGFAYFLKDISRLTRVEVKKLIFSLSLTGSAMLCSFILPFLAFIAWCVALLLLAFQFVDYSFEANKLSFGQRFSFLFNKFFLMMGFGFSCSLFIAIPLLGFLFLPFAVIGAAKIYYQYGQYGKNGS